MKIDLFRNEMQKFRNQLPHGIVKKVAEKLGMSTSTVSQTLNGLRNTTRKVEILKATAEILSELKVEEKAALKTINEILQS